MKPNIFMIDPRLGLEDALTAQWHYLLSVVPGLGQRFIDTICRESGLARAEFVGAVDHPVGDPANHPDLLIQCTGWNLLFEHKVGSPPGPRQLERYIELAAAQGWRLALLAANRVEVSSEVLSSPVFVSPKASAVSGRPSHFLWSDLLPILSKADHHLATEFAEYLEVLGLGKFSWAGLGNPFIDDSASKVLLGLYDSLRGTFASPGVQWRRSANSLIHQIRTPFPPVHLINVGPLQSIAQSVPTVRGPAMGVWVWIRRRKPGQRVLSLTNEDLAQGGLIIHVRNHTDSAGLPYDKLVFNERSYYVPLEAVLVPSLSESADRLVEFVQAAIQHLRTEIAKGAA
jgi:hypothetical protein